MHAAVIVAAGRGSRMGLERNKVLYPLCGEPVVLRTVRAFAESGLFDGGIVVVTGACDMEEMKRMLAEAGVAVRAVVEGGADRQESVRRGILACDGAADIIAIHDGARPLVTREVIERTIESAKAHGSGVAAVALKDTIKRVDESGCVVDTPRRDLLRAVQTPQTFDAALIRQAHERFAGGNAEGLRATDDAMLAEWMGHTVHLTEGDMENIKLTTPEDMLLAGQVLLRRGEAKRTEEETTMRIGHGYDVHRLVEGRKLILCGVEIPHTLGLLGHSDADVAAHALMDALLGAAALGDIGRHFPDTDPQYKGADSMKLLDHVVGLLEQRGYAVGNVDVTIIAQRPKLKDYIETMRTHLAQRLHVETDCVNVKATTTEKLGFEGEGLGISAHAVACIQRAAGRA